MKTLLKIVLWVVAVAAVAATVAILLDRFVFRKKMVEVELSED